MGWLNKQRVFDLMAVALVFLAAVIVNRAPEKKVRLVRDPVEINVYRQRSAFWHRLPAAEMARHSVIDYQQVAICLFAVPAAVANDAGTYHDLYTLMMAAVWAGTYLLARRVLRQMGLASWRAGLLLLPGTLYFTLNRFDIVPALLALEALCALLEERQRLAFGLLAAGTLTKLYPVLYVPLFTVWVWRRNGVRRACEGLAVYAVVAAALGLSWVAWVGWEQALAPYLKQGGRFCNAESLYYILWRWWPAMSSAPAQALFAVAQIAPWLMLPRLRTREPGDVVRWMAAATIVFVVFMRMQSPQWIVWITPLALLGSRTKWELALTVVSDLMAYVYFPVLFDTMGTQNGWFWSFILAMTALRLTLAAMLLRPSAAAQPATN